MRCNILNKGEESQSPDEKNLTEKMTRKKLTKKTFDQSIRYKDKQENFPCIEHKIIEKLPKETVKDSIVDMKRVNREKYLNEQIKPEEYIPIKEIEIDNLKEDKNNRKKDMNEFLQTKFGLEFIKCMKMTVDQILNLKKK